MDVGGIFELGRGAETPGSLCINQASGRLAHRDLCGNFFAMLAARPERLEYLPLTADMRKRMLRVLSLGLITTWVHLET